MFNQQHHQQLSISESMEEVVPQSYYFTHARSISNDSDMSDHPDALTATACYDNNGDATVASYPMQQPELQHYQSVTMDHGVFAVPSLSLTYEDTPKMDDISLAEKEVDRYPTIEEFDKILQGYLNNLSTKKRDKALVDCHRYTLIMRVLKDPRNTAISTAQFRFWVKKMFQLMPHSDGSEILCHDSKPVAMREDIYGILMQAHKQANHGGRDKTSALVRRRYSWIPKELIARFVRHCPFCMARRNGSQSTQTSILPRTTPVYTAESPVAAAAATDTFAVQDGEYGTDVASSIEGLPYLPIEFKSAMSEKDFNIKWPEDSHCHAQQQQVYFHNPLGFPKGIVVPSSASSVAEPVSGHSYSNVFFSAVTAPNLSSCTETPYLSLETEEIYHQPTLLSQCDGMSDLHYGHVGQSLPYSTCHFSSPGSSMDPLTIITPQHQLHQEQHYHHRSNSNDLFVTSNYASHGQAILYDHKMTNAMSANYGQHHQPTIVYPYTLSSPSPSSSFSSSSSYSAPSSPPVSSPLQQAGYMQQQQQNQPLLTEPLFIDRSL